MRAQSQLQFLARAINLAALSAMWQADISLPVAVRARSSAHKHATHFLTAY